MPKAIDDLSRLDRTVAQRAISRLKRLSQSFEELTPEPLAGELKGFYKLRVGSYRVLYTANQADHVLVVHLIGHRRDIYRR